MTLAVLSILINATLRSLLFAGIAALGLKLLGVRDVGARLAAWTVVLYGVLLMPLAVAIAPPLNITIQSAVARPVAAGPIMMHIVPADGPLSLLAPHPPFDWRSTLVIAYAVIAALLFARFLFGWILTVQLRRASRRLDDPRLLARLRDVTAGTHHAPALLESDQLAVPIALGWVRPSILLPVSWREWEDAKLDAVLAHEFSHIQRGDYATLLLSSVNRCLFWFSPLSWWLDRNLRDLAEQASDDCVLRATADHTRYAEVLLGFLEALHKSRGRIRWQGVAMASSERADRRIDRILATNRRLSSPAKWPVLATLAGITLPLLYLSAAVTPRDHATEPSRLIAQATRPAQPAQSTPPTPSTPAAPARNREMHDSYIIVDGDNITMSGSSGMLQRVRGFRYELGNEYLWFQHDGKSYIIRDKALLQEALRLFEPQRDLGRRQADLGEAQAKLGELQAQLGEKQSAVRTTLPDLTRDIERLKEKMRHAGNSEELGELQAMLGEIQAKVGEQQAKIGDQQARIGEEQSKLGEQQSKLGEQQSKLGEEQARHAEEAGRLLKILVDKAIQKGLAEPEPR
jgi:beta-lactamase regulating signal transducer with metallopeptidase domain